jgi:hypothetical protein
VIRLKMLMNIMTVKCCIVHTNTGKSLVLPEQGHYLVSTPCKIQVHIGNTDCRATTVTLLKTMLMLIPRVQSLQSIKYSLQCF